MRGWRIVAMVALVGIATTWSTAARQGTDGQAALTQTGGVEALLGAALHQEDVEGNLRAAIAAYERVLKAPGATRAQSARAYLHIGLCYERLGLAEARKAFETVVKQYGDQAELVVQARSRLRGLQTRAAPDAAAWSEPVPTLIPVRDANFYATSASPDGRYLLGNRVDDWSNHVALELAASAVRPLTHGVPCVSSGVPCDVSGSAVWSPDSQQIAYSWKSAAGTWTVRTSDLRGTVTREFNVDGRVNVLDWSSDGSELLLNTGTIGAWSLRILALDGTQRAVGPTLSWPHRAKLSRTKRFVVLNDGGTRDDSTHLRLLDVERGTSVALLDENTTCRLVGWSADDTGIVLQSAREGSPGLWVLPVAGGAPAGAPRLIKKLAGRISWSALLDDGSIMYQQHFVSGGLQMLEADVKAGKVITPARPIMPQYVDRMVFPVWSPDGTALAFYSEGSPDVRSMFGVLNIWYPASGERRRINPPFTAVGTRITWSTDGTRLYVHGRKPDGSSSGVFVLLAATGQVIETLPLDRTVYTHAVSADGKTVFQNGSNDPASDLVRVDLTSGESHVLFHDEHRRRGAPLIPSPDQTRLLAVLHPRASDSTAPSGVVVIPLDGSTPREVYRGTPQRPVNGAVWMPGGNAILVRTIRSDTNASPGGEVLYVPLDGGAHKLLPFDANLGTLTVHPDGRRMVFSGAPDSTPARIWRIENALPPSKGVTAR